ncbi:MAG TPA: tetratricopeptide repeat protein [Acidobacteriaceae bacterium]
MHNPANEQGALRVIGERAVCTCLLVVVALAAMGQSRQENLNKCRSADPDTKIAGCTVLIQGGQETPENLSSAYEIRGVAYDDKGDYDHAIPDLSESIRLNPRMAASFYSRGIAYNRKGEFDRAIQDYNEAIRMGLSSAPVYEARGHAFRNKGSYDRAIQDYNNAIRLDANYAVAYNDRGECFFHQGDYGGALQGYNEAIRLNPNQLIAYNNRGLVYLIQNRLTEAIADFEHTIFASPSSNAASNAALWLDVASKRQGFDDAHLLAQVASVADLSKWPGPVLKLDLGQLTAADLMAAALNGDARVQSRQVCDANYFTGEAALFHHQRTAALAHLRAARDGCPKSDGVYDAAALELKRLNSSAASVK